MPLERCEKLLMIRLDFFDTQEFTIDMVHTLFHLSCSINESTKYVIATLNCFHDMLTSSNKNPTKVLAFNRN